MTCAWPPWPHAWWPGTTATRWRAAFRPRRCMPSAMWRCRFRVQALQRRWPWRRCLARQPPSPKLETVQPLVLHCANVPWPVRARRLRQRLRQRQRQRPRRQPLPTQPPPMPRPRWRTSSPAPCGPRRPLAWTPISVKTSSTRCARAPSRTLRCAAAACTPAHPPAHPPTAPCARCAATAATATAPRCLSTCSRPPSKPAPAAAACCWAPAPRRRCWATAS